MKKGFLVSFEGGEACGKSTQIRLFKDALTERGTDAIFLREPGGTESGEKIREILLHGKQDLSAASEFLLFSASRSILVENVIAPALASGKIVVLDRFYDSSFAYQGYAGELELESIRKITDLATKGLKPDMTVLFDIDPKVAFERKSADEKLKNLDRIESKGIEFHEKVRAGYLNMAKNEPDRFFVVDATLAADVIHEKVMREFDARINLKN